MERVDDYPHRTRWVRGDQLQRLFERREDGAVGGIHGMQGSKPSRTPRATAGDAFGDGWAYLPIGALVVDLVLTIAIYVSAGASAVIAYLPATAPWRLLLALMLVLVVGGARGSGTWAVVFAVMTVAFRCRGRPCSSSAFLSVLRPTGTLSSTPGHASVLAVALVLHVAIALATGVEAPSSAIAQLGELDVEGRRQFGRVTLWLTLASSARSRSD